MSAASDVQNKIDIYTKTYVDGYHYYYSILFAILLSIFKYAPYQLIHFIWLTLNLFAFMHLIVLLEKSIFVSKLSSTQKKWFILFVLFASLRFFSDNIHYGQITLLLLWCCIMGFVLIFKQKTILGALLLAIGINLKILPIVILPYLLYRAYYKAFFITILIYAALLFMPIIFIGFNHTVFLLKSWWNLINPTHQKHVLDVEERSFHGLSTLISTLFIENVGDTYTLPIKRNIANVSIQTLAVIITVVRVILLFLFVYLLNLKTIFKKPEFLKCTFEFSFLLLLIPLIFPHQQHYAFLFALPALTLCFYFSVYSIKSKKAIALLLIIALIYNLKLLLGVFNNYYEHFKIITYATLFLLVFILITFRKITFLKVLHAPF